LIVEDDLDLANMLKAALSQEGYAADVTDCGEEGESLATAILYDLILLDILLPGKDGLAVCKSLRTQKINTPILLLTAKNENADVILGLNSGADDYLTKPFNLGVLFARIRALIRRGRTISSQELKINNLTIDTLNRQVHRCEAEISLTSKEYAILEYLIQHPNFLVARSTLEQHIWNMQMDNSSNALDVHIKNLRNKLGEENHDLILTIRGQGYRFNYTGNNSERQSVAEEASFTIPNSLLNPR
jgi:DNA-binding response OmpR family regulator